MNRRFLHVLVKDFTNHPCPYALHSINASGLFYPAAVRPNGSGEGTKLEEDYLPDRTVSFHHPSGSGGSMQFMSLGQSNNAIIGVDNECRTILYNTEWHSIRTMPSMHGCKWSPPVSLAVNNSLYVMELYPRQDGHVSFEVLAYGSQHAYGSQPVYGRMPSKPSRAYREDWYWRSLPPPPYVHYQGYEKDEAPPGYDISVEHPYKITASAVVGGGSSSSIWISTAGVGTFAFDTANDTWTKRGDWALPFRGNAEYVAEHGLWFGLSSQGDDLFCASDIAAASVSPPVVLDAWGLDHSKSYLVYLGNGRFCVGRLFHVEEGDTETERFVVLMGMEVEERSDGGDSRVLRMIKHRSKRYRLSAYMTINLVA
uniref:F-box associated domain-containing protein n=1 Tax=Oryza barthii TaxID=65489 RepID=A0A0D3EL78_9ORYZ